MENDLQKSSNIRRQPKQARSQERVDCILSAAEQLFIELGYNQTTTRAIAARAKVPVGSLYQFFSDKKAILKALANRYFEQEYHIFVQLHTELVAAPIEVYINCIVDAFDRFVIAHPGYHPVLEQSINLMTVADINNLNNYDIRILKKLTYFLEQRNPSLNRAKCELIATTILTSVNELLWLSLSSDQIFHKQILTETKTLIIAYLQTYQV